jgi:hypothetical protein
MAYERLKTYPVGVIMRPIARTPDGQWLLAQVISNGEMGWSRGVDTYVVCNSDLGTLLDRLPILNVPTAPAGSVTDTVTPPPTVTPTITETPTPQSTVTATPCALSPDTVFHSVAPTLGCALHPAQPADIAWQRFARGLMLWRAGTVYVMLGTENGRWQSYPDQWQTGMPQVSCGAATGLAFPLVRGFGYRWCQTPSLRAELGDPTSTEGGGQWMVQEFARGWAVQIPEWDNGAVVIFTDDGAWSR